MEHQSNTALQTGNNIPSTRFGGQLVLTTKQIAEFFGTTVDSIKQNFKRNRSHFVKGKHFFKVEGDELRNLKRKVTNCHLAENVNVLYLWTKRGVARHAKILNTETAWAVYEDLEESYFDRPVDEQTKYVQEVQSTNDAYIRVAQLTFRAHAEELFSYLPDSPEKEQKIQEKILSMFKEIGDYLPDPMLQSALTQHTQKLLAEVEEQKLLAKANEQKLLEDK